MSFFRSPFSKGSAKTILFFICIEVSIISSQSKSVKGVFFNFNQRELSEIKACFTTSAKPDFNSLSASVSKNSEEINTAFGLLKSPIWFLNPLKSIPNLPPTDASTIASKVVGM